MGFVFEWIGIGVKCGVDRIVDARRKNGQRRRRIQRPRFLPHNALISGARRIQLRARLGQARIAAGAARLCLRNVGPGAFAHIEARLCGFHLLAQDRDVVFTDAHGFCRREFSAGTGLVFGALAGNALGSRQLQVRRFDFAELLFQADVNIYGLLRQKEQNLVRGTPLRVGAYLNLTDRLYARPMLSYTTGTSGGPGKLVEVGVRF